MAERYDGCIAGQVGDKIEKMWTKRADLWIRPQIVQDDLKQRKQTSELSGVKLQCGQVI